MLDDMTHAWRHESCLTTWVMSGLYLETMKNQYSFLQKRLDSCLTTWLMLDDMTHASQLDSFLVKRSRANPWLHNFECRNSYSILIWERLWLEKVSDYNNSSDVETYPYQVRSFIQKTKKIKCSWNCIFFWGKNSGIHKTLNVPPLSYQKQCVCTFSLYFLSRMIN